MRVLDLFPVAALASVVGMPGAQAQDPDAPIGIAVLVTGEDLPDPAVRDETLRILCDRFPPNGFECAPQDQVQDALGENLHPGPDVLERLAEQLDLPYALAVVLYPGTDDGTIDADIFLQVRGRATGIFRGASDTAEDAAGTAADTALDLVLDAEQRGFSRGTPTVAQNGGETGLAPGPPDDGIIDLTINESLQGIAVAFLSCSSFGIDDWRIIGPTLLMGAGTGLAGALLADYYLPIDQAEAAVTGAGGWWGLLEGGLLALTIGADGMQELAPWSLLGWGLGLGTGITLAATVDLTNGDVALTNSAAAWGTFAGAVIAGTILGRDIFTTDILSISTDTLRNYDYALPFAGLNAGLAAGIVASLFVDVSRGRMALIDLSGLLGVLLGGSLGTPLIFEDPTDNDKRWYSAIMLVSAAAGISLGALLTRDMDDSDNTAAAAMIEVEPAGEVSLHIPVPRPWIDPGLTNARLAPRLGLWVGLAEGSW